MENKLRKLFDYQRFEQNERLAALIDDTEIFYSGELSDDKLETVCAAGDIHGFPKADGNGEDDENKQRGIL